MRHTSTGVDASTKIIAQAGRGLASAADGDISASVNAMPDHQVKIYCDALLCFGPHSAGVLIALPYLMVGHCSWLPKATVQGRESFPGIC